MRLGSLYFHTSGRGDTATKNVFNFHEPNVIKTYLSKSVSNKVII